jgi:hypothetical protein
VPPIEAEGIEIVGKCGLIVHIIGNGEVWALDIFLQDHLGRTMADHFPTDSRRGGVVSGRSGRSASPPIPPLTDPQSKQ